MICCIFFQLCRPPYGRPQLDEYEYGSITVKRNPLKVLICLGAVLAVDFWFFLQKHHDSFAAIFLVFSSLIASCGLGTRLGRLSTSMVCSIIVQRQVLIRFGAVLTFRISILSCRFSSSPWFVAMFERWFAAFSPNFCVLLWPQLAD